MPVVCYGFLGFGASGYLHSREESGDLEFLMRQTEWVGGPKPPIPFLCPRSASLVLLFFQVDPLA